MEDESGCSGQQSTSMPKLGFKVLNCRFCNMKFTQSDEYEAHVEAHKRGEGEALPTGNDINDEGKATVENAEPDPATLHVEGGGDVDEQSLDGGYGIESVEDDDKNEDSDHNLVVDTGEEDEGDVNNGEENEEEGQQKEEKQDPPRKLECVVCGMSDFYNQVALSFHIMSIHRRRFICRFCGIKTASSHSLMRHNMLHLGLKPFECDKCKRKFSRKDALKAHLVTHDKDTVKNMFPRPFVCTKCPASYTRRDNLTRHLDKCHGVKARNRNIADRVPRTTQMRQETVPQVDDTTTPVVHVAERSLTNNAGRKVVSITQQRAQNRLALAKQQNQGQVRRATPNENDIIVNGPRKYPCQFCIVIFNYRSNRSRHVRKFHRDLQQGKGRAQGSTQPPQQQQQQDTQLALFRHSSALKDSLNRAVKSMDRRRAPASQNQLNLKANLADASTRAQQMQIRHARDSIESIVQSNFDRFFKCELCDKVFQKRPSYKLHLRTHNKQFACLVCGVKTATNADLIIHTRTHTGEKPFICSFPGCPWKFARKGALKVHYGRHHGPSAKRKIHYNPERATPNFIQGVDKLPPELDDNSSEEVATNNSNSILKRMLENYPCKSEPRDEDDEIEQASPTVSYQEQKPNKNLPETKELYDCKTCNKHFKDLKTLQNHVNYHQRESKHNCEECGAKFKQKSDLRRHMNIHHNPNNQRMCIACPQCNRSFTHDRYLRVHLTKGCESAPLKRKQDNGHNGEEDENEESYIHAQQEMNETNEDDLQKQMLDENGQPIPLMFVSTIFHEVDLGGTVDEDAGFDKEHDTYQHQPPIFECDLCNTLFSRPNELILHQRNVHATSSQRNFSSPSSTTYDLEGKGKTFSCTKCGISFPQKRELTQHKRQYHSDDLPIHKCQFWIFLGPTTGKSSRMVSSLAQRSRTYRCTEKNTVYAVIELLCKNSLSVCLKL